MLHGPFRPVILPLARWLALLVAGAAASQGAWAADADAEFFTARVEPLLKGRCFGCHAHDTDMSGGLALDVRSGWEKGGQSGPAVIPGDPDRSLLITAVRHGIDGEIMPPDAPLSADDIETLVEWVRRGAPDPRRTTADEAWERVSTKQLRGRDVRLTDVEGRILHDVLA